jgi:hypothetical protein
MAPMNGTIMGSRRSPRGDPWRAFDALPRPIRDALQDGVSPLCPLKVRAVLRVNRRAYGETEAIERVVRLIAKVQAKAGVNEPDRGKIRKAD